MQMSDHNKLSTYKAVEVSITFKGTMLSNKPHDINFLGKLLLQFCVQALRFEDLDSHFLTAVCTFVSETIT